MITIKKTALAIPTPIVEVQYVGNLAQILFQMESVMNVQETAILILIVLETFGVYNDMRVYRILLVVLGTKIVIICVPMKMTFVSVLFYTKMSY